MALGNYTREDIAQIEEDLLDIAHELRKMRQEWESTGPNELQLEIEKAQGFVAYLKTTWLGRLHGQYKISKAKSAADARQRRNPEKGK